MLSEHNPGPGGAPFIILMSNARQVSP
jgi:hypothetical protein